jgi:NodT family efflux transporter outer membrane factor (OMF) lipoprotein
MHSRPIRPALLTLAACAVLAGCPLPSPPKSDDLNTQAMPNLKVPGQWAAGPVDSADVVPGWLASFHDPTLDGLVADAVAYNPDLRVAAARVEAAEAATRAAGGMLYPQLNVLGHGGGKMGGDGSGLQVFGLFAKWEIDLWGRVRASRASSTAQYEATELDRRYARESIAALVAKSWFLAREAALQRAIALQMVGSAEDLVKLTNDRVRVGNSDELESSQAEANVLSYRDLALQAELARDNALRSIELLAGRYPSAALQAPDDLPALPGPVPVGLPSQLLERRPDVVAAERRVAASFYNIRQAQAARLPTISLTASVNSVSSDLIVLKERDNPVWGVGANLLFPLFSGGTLAAQVDVATADQKAALAQYASIGARAFGEVENALSASFNLDRRYDVLARSVQANERALGFVRVRYDVGNADLRAVQQQYLTLYTARSTFTGVRAQQLVQRVNLHLALGGGFEAAPAPAPQAPGGQK